MSGEKMVYVIDPVAPEAGAEKSSIPGEGGTQRSEYLQSSGDGTRKNRESSRPKTSDRESGISLILSYLAGPLSVLATARGRKSSLSAGLALFSVALSLIVIYLWSHFTFWSTPKNPAGAVILLAAISAGLCGTAAWTKAIVLAGRYEGPRLRRSPDWIRGPMAAGLFGFICPGMGLFVSGRSKLASAALWTSCMTIISLILLSRAGWLWDFNNFAGAFAVKPDTLEYMLIGAGAVAVLGSLAWVAQALNGARLAVKSSGRKTVSRGNWAAAALLFSVVAFAAFSRPAVVAELLGNGAEVASGRGMKIIPLQLSLAATRFDPSRPEYAIKAIGFYEDLGDPAAAGVMRGNLIARLAPSIPVLEEEGIIPARHDDRPASEPVIRTIPAELMILDWGMSRALP